MANSINISVNDGIVLFIGKEASFAGLTIAELCQLADTTEEETEAAS